MTPTDTQFTTWFNAQKFRNFSAQEFLSYFHTTRRGVTNSIPPRELWEKIVPTLRVVDNLRDFLGSPIVIVSSYRSPAYNKPIDGAATKSYHMQFCALDIVVAGHSPAEVFHILSAWRKAGKFTGGLGSYNTFTHIDTRGYNATW